MNLRKKLRCLVSQCCRTPGVIKKSLHVPLLFLLYAAGLGSVIERHGMRNHAYADDAQIYGCCKPGDTEALRANMLSCINDVNDWMTSDCLNLNPAKSEFLWCSFP